MKTHTSYACKTFTRVIKTGPTRQEMGGLFGREVVKGVGWVIRFVGAEFTSHNNHEFLIISHTNPFYLRLLFSRIN